jgi:MFS family permease
MRGSRSEKIVEFDTGWRLLAASLIGIAFGVTPMGITYTLGSFIVPLTDEFGWSRQEILTVTVYSTLAFVPASVAAGWLVDRYSPRNLILLSQLGFGLSFFALGLWTDSLRTLYLFYFLMPLLAIGTIQISFSKVLLGHFQSARGLALGIALSGSGLCALSVPPLLAVVVGEWGWRAGYIAAGLVPIVVALPFAYAWIPAGRPMPVKRDQRTVQQQIPDVNVRQAILGWRFWIIASAFFFGSGSAAAVLTNLVPLLEDRGYSSVAAAGALSGLGLSVVIGRIAIGALVDLYWAPLVGVLVLVPAGISVGILAISHPPGWITFVLLGLTGLATGAEIDLCAYLLARYFGIKNYGKLFGAAFVAIAMGAATYGPLFGWLYDTFGSYDKALLASGAGFSLCGLLLLLLGPYPQMQDHTDLSTGES